MTGYIVFSADNCAPCRSLYKYLQSYNIAWPIVYEHAEAKEFMRLKIRSTPTLVKDDQIVAVGLSDILQHIRGLTYFDVTWPLPQSSDEVEVISELIKGEEE